MLLSNKEKFWRQSPLRGLVTGIDSKGGQSSGLVPQLPPGDVIVINNAASHRSQLINEIVAEFGCEIWYLPTYSPDFNKSERWWFVLNNWMKQRWDEFGEFRSLC